MRLYLAGAHSMGSAHANMSQFGDFPHFLDTPPDTIRIRTYEKGKPSERLGRKVSGLKVLVTYDSGIARSIYVKPTVVCPSVASLSGFLHLYPIAL